MIYCSISGGLGNQMFMYACGYAVARSRSDKLVLDASILDCHKTRQFELKSFNLDPCKIITYRDAKLDIVRKLLRLAKDIRLRPLCKTIRGVPTGQYKPIEEDAKNIYLDGFWQCEKYFEAYKKDIRRQFTIKKETSEQYKIILSQIEKTNSVALHIRLDDYKENKWCIDPEFYWKAIEFISKRISEPLFFVFSDSPHEARKMFQNVGNAVFVEYDSDSRTIEDQSLISKCKHQIISNSTYSWWGAWLNDFEKKIVVCPDYDVWTGDFYPNEWIKIQAKGRNSNT